MQLTSGEGDGTGWWAPRWSSDGQRLAMLSMRRDNVTLWVTTPDDGETAKVCIEIWNLMPRLR